LSDDTPDAGETEPAEAPDQAAAGAAEPGDSAEPDHGPEPEDTGESEDKAEPEAAAEPDEVEEPEDQAEPDEVAEPGETEEPGDETEPEAEAEPDEAAEPDHAEEPEDEAEPNETADPDDAEGPSDEAEPDDRAEPEDAGTPDQDDEEDRDDQDEDSEDQATADDTAALETPPEAAGFATRRSLRGRSRRRSRKLLFVVGALVAVTVIAWAVIIVAGNGRQRPTAAGPSLAQGDLSVFKIEPPPPDVASQPTHLRIEAIDVDANIVPYTVEDAKQGSDGLTGQPCYEDGVITCVDPPSLQLVYWQVGGRAGVEYGDMPGGDSRGTVYLHGHAGDPAQEPVFNNLPNLQIGDTAEVSTEYGVFTYTVETVRNIPKDDYPWDPEALKQVPGRLLLVTCFHGQDATTEGGFSTDNTVVTLRLSDTRGLDS
jgi:LPXTG-site transpeptidase (sortase) family protein